MNNTAFGTGFGKPYRFDNDVMYNVLNNYFNNNNGYYLDTADRYDNLKIIGDCLKN
tara:strand:+ start:10423 stop:10590 length:168 start_codon:yes stop_codon:yes gene_type:complete